MDILIVGVGKFGSALSKLYGLKGFRVHELKSSKSLLRLSDSDLRRCYTLLCVPTQRLPEVVARRGTALSRTRAVISTAKGLLQTTNETPSVFLRKNLQKGLPLFTLSGPSFAAEIKKGHPTALVLAGHDVPLVDELSQALATQTLRLYKSSDPLGVELCGALKNVYAIAAGVSQGLGFGDNTLAALNTRALAEMARIAQALGAEPLTVFGLAGVGDLFLTCSSRQSRNFQFGMGLAQGASISSLVKKIGTIEGLWTTNVAQHICQKKKLRAPILATVAALVNKKLAPGRAMMQLMNRKVRHEFD